MGFPLHHQRSLRILLGSGDEEPFPRASRQNVGRSVPSSLRARVPRSTFAAEMGLVEKGVSLGGPTKRTDSAEETEIETHNAPTSKEVG